MTAPLRSLEDLLRPLRYLDLSAIYARYWAVIDLFVYTTIFVGVARAALRSRMPGRGGQAVSAGVGVSLAFGMVLLEHRQGISLQTFGPAAVVLIVLLFGLMVHGMLRHVGIQGGTATAAAYTATTVTAMVTVPEALRWLTGRVPVATVAIVVGLIVSIAALAASILPTTRAAPTGTSPGKFLRRLVRASPRPSGRQRENQPDLKPTTQRLGEADERILKDTRSALRAVRRSDGRLESRRRIAGALLELDANTRSILPMVAKLSERLAALQRLDDIALKGEKRAWLSAQTDEEKALLKKELHAHMKRRGVEKRLRRLEESARRHTTAVASCLRDSARCLLSDRTNKAIRELKVAIAAEKKLRELGREARALVDELDRIALMDWRESRKTQSG